MIDKRIFRHFDYTSCVLMLALIGIGLTFIFSATYTPEKPFSFFFKKEVIGIVSGMIIYAACSFMPTRHLITWGYYGFYLTLALLCYTILSGYIGMGAKRWISLYFIRFQPSELVKMVLPFYLAISITQHKDAIDYRIRIPFHVFVKPLFFLGIAFLLILRQPDLGTALLIAFSGFATMWLAGLSRRFFIILGCACLISAPLLWKGMQPYQRTRVLSLLGYGSKNNERYQVEQSKIAIGSGGLAGKGLLKGTQNKLGFLPEDHTDFIFSVVCEEWGFLGALLVLLLFSGLFARLFFLVYAMPLALERLLVFGLMVPIMLSTMINIGMVTGLLPTVGIPLPLMTYGITHLWSSMASLGMIQNLAIRRFYY